MPTFNMDDARRQLTLTFRKGGQVARTATLNGNTIRYDINGQVVDYLITSPFGASGCILNGLPEHDMAREMLRFFQHVVPTD